MKISKLSKLAGIGALALLVSSCSSYSVRNKQEDAEKTIRGVPVSVSFSPDYNHISTVVYADRKMLLCEGIVRTNKSQDGDSASKTCRNLMALIQSEINDGDEEKIEIKGNYGTDYGKEAFDIKKIKVQGYEIKLDGGQD